MPCDNRRQVAIYNIRFNISRELGRKQRLAHAAANIEDPHVLTGNDQRHCPRRVSGSNAISHSP